MMQQTREHIDLMENQHGDVYLVEWYEEQPHTLGQSTESYTFFGGPLTPPILEELPRMETERVELFIMNKLPEAILTKCRGEHEYLSGLRWKPIRRLANTPSVKGAREDINA